MSYIGYSDTMRHFLEGHIWHECYVAEHPYIGMSTYVTSRLPREDIGTESYSEKSNGLHD
jgi:hypothetical protein